MVDKFGLAEQLKYHRAFNEYKAAAKKKAAEEEAAKNPPKEEKKDGEFKILSNAELGKLPLAEQLQYARKKNDLAAKEKKEKQKKEKEAAKDEQTRLQKLDLLKDAVAG